MGPTQHSRFAGTPSTSGRQDVTPRPQGSRNSPNLQLYPKRVGGGYGLVASGDKDPLTAPGAVSQALRALPANEHPYSQYDLDLVAEILRKGDAQVHKELCSGTGSGEVSKADLVRRTTSCLLCAPCSRLASHAYVLPEQSTIIIMYMPAGQAS